MALAISPWWGEKWAPHGLIIIPQTSLSILDLHALHSLPKHLQHATSVPASRFCNFVPLLLLLSVYKAPPFPSSRCRPKHCTPCSITCSCNCASDRKWQNGSDRMLLRNEDGLKPELSLCNCAASGANGAV